MTHPALGLAAALAALIAQVGCSGQGAEGSARSPVVSLEPTGVVDTDPAAAVLDRARRPVAGIAYAGRVLLLYANRDGVAVRIYTDHGVAEPLVDTGDPPYFWELPELTSYGRNVVIVPDGPRAWHVNARGTVRRLAFSSRSIVPRTGDVLVRPSSPTIDGRGGPAFTRAWVLRPASRMVFKDVDLPSGAHITHMDGRGTLWAIARPSRGRSVLLSSTPGGDWRRHVVGRHSPTFVGCACDTEPGPHGRDGALVLAGNPLQHVSTDHGRTWRTFDVRRSAPYRHVIAMSRGPRVGGLADGRLVIGYDRYWVADDPENTSFTEVPDFMSTLWEAGMDDLLLFEGDQASPDGGQTWVTYRP